MPTELQRPQPATRLAMGNCASSAEGGAVHAAERLPVSAHGTRQAGSPLAAAPTVRLAKRGAVGEAEQAAGEEDTLESLPKHVKTEAQAALITAAIADNILFRVRPCACARAVPPRPVLTHARARGVTWQDLQEPELQALLINALTPLTVAAGEVVIQQGARGGDTFYVVQAGGCEVLVDGARVATRGAGSAFGELALLYSCPRAATVRATEASQLWVLHQRWYRLVARSAAALRVAQKARAWRGCFDSRTATHVTRSASSDAHAARPLPRPVSRCPSCAR